MVWFWDVLRLVILLIVCYFFARWFLGFGIGAPYIPVRRRDLEDAMALADLRPSDVVVDLGSGDGRVLEAAAEKGARVIGYEINPLLCWIARRRLRRFGDRAIVHGKNLLEADLSQATVIFVFGISQLMPKIGEMVRQKFLPLAKGEIKREPSPSFTRRGVLISVAFELPGFEPAEERGVVKKYFMER
jgi:hypothetical protein